MPWALRFAVPDVADFITDIKGAIAVHLDDFPSDFLPGTPGGSHRSTSNPTRSRFRSIGRDTTLCGCSPSVGDLTGTSWGTFLLLTQRVNLFFAILLNSASLCALF